jgi:translation initiation factor IF-1
MPKADMIETEGYITALHRGGMMTVVLDNGHEVLAKPCGKMMLNHIRCLVSDRVQVEISPYDMDRARVTYRFK